MIWRNLDSVHARTVAAPSEFCTDTVRSSDLECEVKPGPTMNCAQNEGIASPLCFLPERCVPGNEFDDPRVRRLEELFNP